MYELFGISLLVLLSSCVAYFINNEVPSPYMDEIFHIPQVQEYCRYNFTYWNPMITTPPGLYVTSILVLKPFHWLLGKSFCTVSILRILNILFTTGTFLVINSLLKSLHPSVKPAISFSFTLTTFPLLFFFTFLYYTDCGSTFTTLLGYWLSRKQHHLISAIVLFVSVLFRQTNIIWAGFIAGTVFLSQLNPQSSTRSFFHFLFNLFCEVYSKLFVILLMVWPYVVLAVVFGVFVISNGGIVLGDKSHHVASLHLPQIFYFCGFCCLFSVGSNLFHLKQFLKSLFNYLNVVVFMVLCLIGYIAVHYWTYEHPYLLADNRHYPFYIWKNFYRANDINRYLLIPVYSLCVSMMIMTLGEAQPLLWIILYFGSCCLSLVPQSLIEFRYFIIPYLMYRLHTRPPLFLGVIMELLTYTAINVITIWLFIKRPFIWKDQESQFQRFMW